MQLEKMSINKEGFFIRAMKMTDADSYMALLTHPEVKLFIPEQLVPKSLFDMVRIINQLQGLSSSNNGAYWAICNPDGKLVGSAGFESWSQFHRRLELAFELHPDYQGKGIMTQALLKIIDIGFHQMNAVRIEAFTLTHNQASIKLLSRLNFTREAELKKYRIFNKKIHNILLFALLNDSN